MQIDSVSVKYRTNLTDQGIWKVTEQTRDSLRNTAIPKLHKAVKDSPTKEIAEQTATIFSFNAYTVTRNLRHAQRMDEYWIILLLSIFSSPT